MDRHSPSTRLPPNASARGHWPGPLAAPRRPPGRYLPDVRQLLPTPIDDVDPLDLYPTADRPTPGSRPWVMVNMITTLDGAIEIDGVSGGLGGPADRDVFRAIRASADWILVAAGTVRAERYGPPRLPEAARERRVARGKPADPRLAVVTGRLDLDSDLPLFARLEPDEPQPVVITGSEADPGRLDALADRAEMVVLDDARPSPSTVLDELNRRGAAVVLVEGGPSFNGQLASDRFVDELCLSISPLVVAGPSGRIMASARATSGTEMTLAHLLEQDDYLFARYVRR